MPLRKVGIAGTGSFLPEGKITNADLERMVDTTDEWITTRTGIKERRRSAPGQTTSDLAYEASIKAMQAAGVTADQLDAIIVATISPDMHLPSTACFLQKKLLAMNCSAHDMAAACSGFIYGLKTAKALVASGEADTVLLVGAEELTKYTNYKDRTSCILFGDGAGAAIIRPAEGRHELLDVFVRADCSTDSAMSMILRCGGSQSPFCQAALDNLEQYIILNGREVYKFAVNTFTELIQNEADRMGIPVSEIDWIVPHQVNLRIVQGAAERLNFPLERIYLNIEKYGNTSAASVPIALDEAVRGGHIKEGQLVVMAAFGAGLTWGSATIRW